MENRKITTFQLFCLITLFELGTAAMLPLGLGAKQDAWLSILIGMLGGIGIFSIYFYLYIQFPNLLLTSYVRKILGKYAGTFIGLLYILFFIYGASRDLRDGIELLMGAYLQTPHFALGTLFTIVMCYALYLGIEVLARTGEIYFIFFLLGAVITLGLLLSSNVLDIHRAMPVLENGWKPVLATVYGQTLMFPFGELICFTMILPYLDKPKAGFKAGVIAILLSGGILALTIFFQISVLGVKITERSIFPFLDMMQEVNTKGIVRIDSLVVVALIVNVFFKVAIFSYAAIISYADLFKVQKKKLAVPVSLIILATSLAVAEDAVEHFTEGELVLKFIFLPMGLVIPVLLMVIVMIRKRLIG